MEKSSITPDDFARRMDEISRRYEKDIESVHEKADDLICQVMRDMGYTAGIDIFLRMPKWYA